MHTLKEGSKYIIDNDMVFLIWMIEVPAWGEKVAPSLWLRDHKKKFLRIFSRS